MRKNVLNVAFAIEDEPGQAKALAGIGLFVYLIDAPYNQDIEGKNIKRILKIHDIITDQSQKMKGQENGKIQ